MKFWVGSGLLYAIFLLAGLGLPVLGLAGRSQTFAVGILLALAAMALLLLASLVLTLIVARRFVPEYWWRSQALLQDIYNFQGVYFVGARQTRQASRLYRVIFGMDEQVRRWNLSLGLLLMALLPVHLMGSYTTFVYFSEIFTERPVFAETLHESTLSALPVMREWGVSWKAHPALAARVERTLKAAAKAKNQGIPEWFRLAELQLLHAFRVREDFRDSYSSSPGDTIVFDRAQGGRAVLYLNRLMARPETERAGLTSAALTLLGFFHLSDRNYSRAADHFDRALAAAGSGEGEKIPRFQIALLAAQAALLSGDLDKAEVLLNSILENDRLPPRAYTLAMGHFADTRRLKGQTKRAGELLAKASELYDSQKQQGGEIARVHLRLAALALDEGREEDARRELSIASSLAHGLEDGFTLNMVGWLAQFFPSS